MKKIYLRSAWALLALLIFSISSFAQEKDLLSHLTIVNDGSKYLSCNTPLNSNSTIEIDLMASNLEQALNCPAFRLLVETVQGNIPLGVSDPISTDPATWDETDEHFGSCNPSNNFKIYHKEVEIPLSFSTSTNCLPGVEGISLSVRYVIVEAFPDTEGIYVPYYDNNLGCANVIFHDWCFDHDSNAYDPYATQSTLCFKCIENSNGGTKAPTMDYNFAFQGQQKSSITNGDHLGASINQGTAFLIYPTYFTNEIKLQFHSEKTFNSNCQIFGMDGKTYWSQQMEIEKGANLISFRPAQLPAGIYSFRFWDGRNWQTSKIIKSGL